MLLSHRRQRNSLSIQSSRECAFRSCHGVKLRPSQTIYGMRLHPPFLSVFEGSRPLSQRIDIDRRAVDTMRDATDYAACYTSLEDSARSALHRRSDVFDTVMRGFSRFVDESSELLGFDLLFVLAWGLLIVAATKFVEFAVRHVWRLIKWLVASEVIIEPKPGTVSSYVVSWIESQALVGGSSILAEQLVSDENSTDKDEARFNHTAGAVPVRELTKAKYTIAGLAFFVYRRRLFWYKPLEDSESGSSGLANKRAVISCLGFSVEPIKAFVANAALVYRKAQTPRTQILRPGIVLWRLVATQCARPVDTVILGQTDKVNVLTDIHMYLQPFAAE